MDYLLLAGVILIFVFASAVVVVAGLVHRAITRLCKADTVVLQALSDILVVAERTESRVERQDQQRRALLDASDHGVFFCDADGRNTFVSMPYAALLGAEVAELMGHGWRDFVAGGSPSLSAYDRAWQDAFQSAATTTLSVRLLRRSAAGPQEFQARIRLVAVTARGKVEHYLGIVSAA